MIKHMNKERKEAYVEVLEVLNNMESKYIEKVPSKLIEFFKKNSSKDYEFHLDKTIPFEEQKLKENTINILAMLNLNYWCENEEHKKNLLKKYYDNEMRYQEKLMEQYSTDNLFKKKQEQPSNTDQNMQLVEQKEIKWYHKIFNKAINIIKRILKKEE